MLIETVLERKRVKTGVRLTVKAAVAAFVIALAVALPQIVHLTAGASGGVRWLPMYAPILLGGCLLGVKWGLGAGIAAPIVSFAITSALGSAMPAAARLPYMIAELAVFAAVSGAFSTLGRRSRRYCSPRSRAERCFLHSRQSSKASLRSTRRLYGARFKAACSAWFCRRSSCRQS